MKTLWARWRRMVWGSVIVLLCWAPVSAKDFQVSDLASFIAAQASASPGDVIIWKSGTYAGVNLSIVRSGITVRAETSGGVTFTGTSTCVIAGDSIVFSGFQYVGGDIGAGDLVVISGSRNVVAHCNFQGVNAYHYVQINGGTHHNDVSYCNIEAKPMTSINSAIQVSTSATVPGYHRIRYCSFKNFPGPGGDAGNEPIRLGVGEEKTNVSRTIVEYCYFENVGAGDSESISIKCTETVCRYNTFNKNVGGMLVFRQGYRNVAYGNFFLNGSGGIRIKAGGEEYVYNNYFATGTGEPLRLDFDATAPLDSVCVVHNTFVECSPLRLIISGPTNVVIANNVFKRSSGTIMDGITASIRFFGNIIQGLPGIVLPPGNTITDPQLILNSDGYFGLAPGSPAIDAADTNYPSIVNIAGTENDPNVMLDISGQTRPAERRLKDVGCDEYAGGLTTNRPLTLSDVGPVYLRSTSVEDEKMLPQSFHLRQNYPNPFNPSTVISFELPVASVVRLTVYDILGREVAVIASGQFTAGRHDLPFDASGLASGVYPYRLETNGFVQTRAMMVTR